MLLRLKEVNSKSLIDLSRQLKKCRINDLITYKKSKELRNKLLLAIKWSMESSDDFWQKIIPVKDTLEKCLESFAKRYSKASPRIKHLVRYLLWNTHYSFDKPLEIANKLVKTGHLLKSNDKYYVTGLHLAVGSDVFGVSATGGKYRLTVSCCDIQAFCVNNRWNNLLKSFEEENKLKVKKLDTKTYSKYKVGNEEGNVMVSFTKEDKQFILKNYVEE